jgi:hypothetical protein
LPTINHSSQSDSGLWPSHDRVVYALNPKNEWFGAVLN